MTARPHARRRHASPRGRWLAALGGLVVALAVWLVLCVDHVARPEVDPVGPVDAAYLIGPAETKIDAALAIMDEGAAPVLLATTSVNAETGEAYATGHCGLEAPAYRVGCVLPEPYTTRGEARLLAAQVDDHGWSRVAVITSTPHAARTRMLMERCVDAEVLLWTVDTSGSGSLRGWAGQFVYQSAAWVKAQVVRDC